MHADTSLRCVNLKDLLLLFHSKHRNVYIDIEMFGYVIYAPSNTEYFSMDGWMNEWMNGWIDNIPQITRFCFYFNRFCLNMGVVVWSMCMLRCRSFFCFFFSLLRETIHSTSCIKYKTEMSNWEWVTRKWTVNTRLYPATLYIFM